MSEVDPDNDRNRLRYLDHLKERRGSIVPKSLKFGDPGGLGRRITPVANRD